MGLFTKKLLEQIEDLKLLLLEETFKSVTYELRFFKETVVDHAINSLRKLYAGNNSDSYAVELGINERYWIKRFEDCISKPLEIAANKVKGEERSKIKAVINHIGQIRSLLSYAAYLSTDNYWPGISHAGGHYNIASVDLKNETTRHTIKRMMQAFLKIKYAI